MYASLLIVYAVLAAQPFHLLRTEEASIADIHRALEAGRITCRELVARYLARIEAYDQKGPALNAIVLVNPDALAEAESMDEEIARDGIARALTCVPVIVKDNYETEGLPTTAGSLSLSGFVPEDDAFQVRRIRDEGAIVLAKSNMAEFAFTPYETVSSILPGYTKNPYALDRVTAGSSGGTAAAVAASFGAVGLGTDTGNSIRGPSSHTALVGIRSTMGLTSRDGIVPLNLERDIGGPMARTVEDAVRILDVIAGYDPADPVTAASRDRKPESYLSSLTRDGLRGARIGALRQLAAPGDADAEILNLFDRALEDMKSQGADVVEVTLAALDEIDSSDLWCNRFRHDLEDYLAAAAPSIPVKTLQQIIDAGTFHPSIEKRLRDAQEIQRGPDEECAKARDSGERLRRAVREALSEHRLDALVYPTWSHPPRRIGDLNTPHGNNSPRISPPTGFPAITVPMGFVRAGLPAGIQFLGEAWSEPALIRLSYAYEQATRHRTPPPATPPLAFSKETENHEQQ